MKRRNLWAVLALLWLATALRFYRLDAQSFWNDEGNSARLAERSAALIVEGAAADIHPPLYYLALHAWRALLGESEFALRGLSAFAGVVLVAGVYGLGRRLEIGRLGDWRFVGARQVGARRSRDSNLASDLPRPYTSAPPYLPLLAALFAAVHPALVYYSQEARMYGLLGLGAVVSTLILLRLLPLLGQRATRMTYVWAAGYLVVVVAGLYLHYFFPVVLLSHSLIVGLGLLWGSDLQNRFTVVGRWLGLMVAGFLLYLPWLPILLRQAGGRGADAVSSLTFLGNAAHWLVLGETVAANGAWWAVGAVMVLAVIGIVAGGRGEAGRSGVGLANPNCFPTCLAPTLGLLLPPLLMLLAGTTRPAYHKFLIIAAPFVCLLAARGVVVLGRLGDWRTGDWRLGIGRLRRHAEVAEASHSLTRSPARWLSRAALLLLVALGLWGTVRSLRNMYFDPAFARADYRGIAAWIAAEGHPDAGIVLNAANQWEVFTYYHREGDGAPVYPLPRGQPDAQRIEAELQEIAAEHDRVYALFWGEAERDPQRLVERWLDANAFKAREEWAGDVRFVTYAVPPAPASEMEVGANVEFGPHIELLGYTIGGELFAPGDYAPGDIVPVTLFWQTTQPLDTRYKVFLHLLDEEEQLVAQRDAEPVGNLAPTTTWQPVQTVVDNHGLLLPADLPPGRYALRLGLYPLDDPSARLPVVSSAGAGDSYPLTTVTLR